MSETEPAESQTPRIWIETLLATEQEISDLLDEAKRLYLRGEKREVRRMLANLFEADSGVYRAITYSVSGGDDFFSDVEEQMSEETVKKVEELGQSYSLLSNEIIAVFNQNSNDTKNIITGGRLSQKYDPESQTSLLRLKFMSGDTTLLETRNSIGRIIYLSDLTLQAALSGLEMTTDQRLSLNSEEKELIEQQIDDLSRTLTLIEELFEEQRLEEAQEDE